MLRTWIFFIFTISAFAEEWVLNRRVFETHFGSEVAPDELQEALKGEGIEIRFEERQERILWKGKKAAISLAAAPVVPYHLWVDIEGRASLDECSGEDFEELTEAVGRARTALKQAAGADSFLIFATDAPRSGKGSGCAGIEIVPSNLLNQAMDASEKGRVNAYMLYNDFSKSSFEESAEIVSALRSLLADLKSAIEPEAPLVDWVQKLSRHKEAVHRNLAKIYEELHSCGAVCSGKKPAAPPPDDEILELRINAHRCPFCVPQVIDPQIVMEWKGINITMNHKPFAPHGNFLIFPKRHQCSWDLKKDEVRPFWEAASAVKKVLKGLCPEGEVIFYVQDGMASGQTVPHTHMHVYVIPNPLKLRLTDIQHIHNKRRILTPEEMRKNCERYRELIALS